MTEPSALKRAHEECPCAHLRKTGPLACCAKNVTCIRELCKWLGHAAIDAAVAEARRDGEEAAAKAIVIKADQERAAVQEAGRREGAKAVCLCNCHYGNAREMFPQEHANCRECVRGLITEAENLGAREMRERAASEADEGDAPTFIANRIRALPLPGEEIESIRRQDERNQRVEDEDIR